ncbi:MAG: carboxypeptidase regulatory-like domain-containing protein [Prevotellaceae bacterium]|jgi:hypothetical protein|nr:carboxypeptidase regulatory-like domain-containing protein [Prevotellaceae bacterium]
MQRFVFFLFFLFASLHLFSQTTEYYLQIKIDDRSDLDYLTRIVSIDKVTGLDVIAYANEIQFEKLKATKFQFIELEHPSIQAGRASTMATTLAEMVNWDRYPTYDVYNQRMEKFETDYPNMCKLYIAGKSFQNRNILVLNVTSNIAANKAKPEVLLSSTMHGDETTGWILCMRLAHYLLTEYGKDSRITELLDSVSIFIAPNTNPDGTYYGGNSTVFSAIRNNANGVDLNRNFPDPWVGPNPNGPTQQETTVMMNYAGTKNFILGANYHGGAEVANYPWDGWRTTLKIHPDNDWFIQICQQYVALAKANGPSGYFTSVTSSGVTNGGDWYVIDGGRQDYMGYWHNCKEITLEISNTKMVQSDQLPNYWEYNHAAMLSFIENVYYGVRGKVTNSQGDPLPATITVGHDADNSHVKTNPQYGNYYRMLSPGTYTFNFESYGYVTQTIPNVVVTGQNSTVYLNVVMQPKQAYTVSGTVRDVHNGLPLSGVTVSLPNMPNPSVTTDASGSFTIANVMGGENQFLFEKEGYQRKKITIMVTNGSEIHTALNIFEGISFEDGIIPSDFTFSGNLPWYITNTEAYHGTRSIRSGAITHNQSSTMQYTFACESPGEVIYYAKVSTEDNGAFYDYLEFFIDNVSKGKWRGEIDWSEYAFDVSAGTHTLKWTYSRDVSTSGGQDAVFVDFIVVPKNYAATTYTTITSSVNGGNGTIAPSGSVTVALGSSQSFTITPNTGFRISEVLIDGYNDAAAITAGSYTFTNVTTDHSIVASFLDVDPDPADPALIAITVNNNILPISDNMFYMADCNEDYVELNLTSEGTIEVNGCPYMAGMNIPLSNDITVINIKIIAFSTTTSYTLNISKALGSSSAPMYIQRWGKTLAVVNNAEYNGGHTFDEYRWYLLTGTLRTLLPETSGYILLSGRQASEYIAEVHSMKTSEWHKLCPYVKSQEQIEIAVYPNPVNAGQLLTLNLPEGVDKVNVNIYDISGNLVRQQKDVHSAVTAPSYAGMYIMEIQLPDGTKHALQIIVK